MARKKKEETLVHLDLEEMAKPIRRRKSVNSQEEKIDVSTVGGVLQQARLNRKLKLSSVSKKLCIKEIYLDALEKGHYYAFPGLVYGIGFLRTYANFLGLDASELVERFHQETSDIKTEPMELPQAENTYALPSLKCIFKSLSVLFLLYLSWFIIKVAVTDEELSVSVPALVEATSSSVETTSIVEEVIVPVSAEEIKPKTENQINSKPVPEEKKDMSQKSTATPVAAKRTPVTYGLKNPARVSFLATEKVWIEVRDAEADRILLSKVLEVGDRYNPIEEADGLVLKTADANALSLYIDGKFIRKVGTKGIKSGILLNADDLIRD